MKDTVKITVIATGFREVKPSRARVAEAHHSFADSHDDAMHFPDPMGPAQPMSDPEPIRHPLPEPVMLNSRMDDSGMQESRTPALPSTAMAYAGTDAISLNTVRGAMVANFEQDDLDVPAFLRKRSEIM